MRLKYSLTIEVLQKGNNFSIDGHWLERELLVAKDVYVIEQIIERNSMITSIFACLLSV